MTVFNSPCDALMFALKEQKSVVALKIQRMFYDLRREQKILQDHLSVLQHYSKRGSAPNPAHDAEVKASKLWGEMMSALEPLLKKEGYLQ